jgi:hypothetical protein
VLAVRWPVRLVVAVVLAAGIDAPSAAAGDTVFPFVPGTTWTYAGSVKWTVPDTTPTQVRTSEVRWTSRIVDAFDHGDVAAALLSGSVWDVAWWSRENVPGRIVVVRSGACYFLVNDHADDIFRALKRSRRSALPAHSELDPWFSVPLTVGQVSRPADLGPRDDTYYGWLVERASGPGYVLTYRTLASEDSVTLVPGIGITSFLFRHHGTVAEAHLHLVAYRPGRRAEHAQRRSR